MIKNEASKGQYFSSLQLQARRTLAAIAVPNARPCGTTNRTLHPELYGRFDAKEYTGVQRRTQVCEAAAPYPVFNCSPLKSKIKTRPTPQYNRNQLQLQITTQVLS